MNRIDTLYAEAESKLRAYLATGLDGYRQQAWDRLTATGMDLSRVPTDREGAELLLSHIGTPSVEAVADRLTALYDGATTTTTDADVSAARAALTALRAADVQAVSRLIGVRPASTKGGTVRRIVDRIAQRRDRYQRAAAFSAGPAAPLCPDVTVE